MEDGRQVSLVFETPGDSLGAAHGAMTSSRRECTCGVEFVLAWIAIAIATGCGARTAPIAPDACVSDGGFVGSGPFEGVWEGTATTQILPGTGAPITTTERSRFEVHSSPSNSGYDLHLDFNTAHNRAGCQLPGNRCNTRARLVERPLAPRLQCYFTADPSHVERTQFFLVSGILTLRASLQIRLEFDTTGDAGALSGARIVVTFVGDRI